MTALATRESITGGRPPHLPARPCFSRISSRQHFEQVPVRVPKIKSAAAVPVVDFHVLRGARATAIGEALGADPVENPVELVLADPEGVMVAFEAVPIVEIDRQGVVDAHRGEVRDRALVFETEYPGEEPGGLLLVAGGDDRVVEKDGHERLRFVPIKMTTPAAIGNSSTNGGGDRGAEILCFGVAAEIGGAGSAFGEHFGDRALDRGRRS